MDGLKDELGIIAAGLAGTAGDIRNGISVIREFLRVQDRRFWWFVYCCLVGAAIILILASSIPRVIYARDMTKCKQNLHAVQLALERFAVDSPGCVYPLRLEELSEQSYMPVMPTNPFTGQPMRWEVYGSYDQAAQNPDRLNHGDFGYVIVPSNYQRGSAVDLATVDPEDVQGYALVLY
ncbi:hypothetical protein JW859_06310 [bacterium]|nr:hypothetical protein [bacterium]